MERGLPRDIRSDDGGEGDGGVVGGGIGERPKGGGHRKGHVRVCRNLPAGGSATKRGNLGVVQGEGDLGKGEGWQVTGTQHHHSHFFVKECKCSCWTAKAN